MQNRLISLCSRTVYVLPVVMSSLPSVDSSGTEGNAPIHAPGK